MTKAALLAGVLSGVLAIAAGAASAQEVTLKAVTSDRKSTRLNSSHT